MNRNPFLKEDKGCTFICYLLIFASVQAIYYTFYIDPIFFRDYTLDLANMAIEMGYQFDPKSGNFSPKIDS